MEEQPDAQQQAPRVEHSLKPREELLRPESAPLAEALPGAPERSLVTMKPAEAQPRAQERPEPLVAQPPTLQEASPLASSPVAQRLQASLPEHA